MTKRKNYNRTLKRHNYNVYLLLPDFHFMYCAPVHMRSEKTGAHGLLRQEREGFHR